MIISVGISQHTVLLQFVFFYYWSVADQLCECTVKQPKTVWIISAPYFLQVTVLALPDTGTFKFSDGI